MVAADRSAASLPELVQSLFARLPTALDANSPRWHAPRKPTADGVDGQLAFRVGDTKVRMSTIFRSRLSADLLGLLAHLQQQIGDSAPPLLLACTHRIPAAIQRRLQELGISFMDMAGNVSLRAAGVLVHARGRQAAARPSGRQRLGSTDLRLLHVLQCEGGSDGQSHRQLASAARIALGAVGKALRTLEAHKLLRPRGEGRWDIVDAAAAQTAFVEGWSTVLRRKLRPRRFRSLSKDLRAAVLAASPSVARTCSVGGELAATMTTHALQSQCATLHVQPEAEAALRDRLRLVPDADGPVTLLDPFGQTVMRAVGDREVGLAHPLLVHAELVFAGDERLAQAIDEVWQQCLEARPRPGR